MKYPNPLPHGEEGNSKDSWGKILKLAWMFPACLPGDSPELFAGWGSFQAGLIVRKHFLRGPDEFRRFFQDIRQ